jgi:signal transduction histidine kinase
MDSTPTNLETPPASAANPAIEELAAIAVFSDLPPDGLAWLASQMTTVELQPGDVLSHAGDPADHLLVLFRGEVQAERPDGRVFIVHAGQVSGYLPYSRLKTYAATVRAVVESRGARLHKEKFPEMLDRMPVLHQKLVSLMADRIRETSVADQQREKLLALGRISAGLAHELNNPASAARRAVGSLREAFTSVRSAALQLEEHGLPLSSRLFLAQLDCDWLEQAGTRSALDTLERSEREDEFAAWLQNHNVPNSWDLAASLVDAGCDRNMLEQVAKQIPSEFLGDAFVRMTASITISRLIEEIESSIGKISDIVRAVKEYSYMDQMPEQEVDIHAGLENTLIMLRHQLKAGIEVSRDYDRTLPKICARGSELNQVWTNLISNAIDAMDGKGKLRIRTFRDPTCAVVEVMDDGPGIPPEIQTRIFEPFFTTKAVGGGTGLGLDTAFRIVTNHRGDIRFDSRPGETRFTVRIPFSRSK